MRGGTPGCPDIPEWLASNVPEGGRVGIDPFVHTVRDPAQTLPREITVLAPPMLAPHAASMVIHQQVQALACTYSLRASLAPARPTVTYKTVSMCAAMTHGLPELAHAGVQVDSALVLEKKLSSAGCCLVQLLARDTVHAGCQVDSALALEKKLSSAGRALAPLLTGNLVDAIWGAGRPGPPAAPLRVHPLEHAGESAADKVQRMRREMAGAPGSGLCGLVGWRCGGKTLCRVFVQHR